MGSRAATLSVIRFSSHSPWIQPVHATYVTGCTKCGLNPENFQHSLQRVSPSVFPAGQSAFGDEKPAAIQRFSALEVGAVAADSSLPVALPRLQLGTKLLSNSSYAKRKKGKERRDLPSHSIDVGRSMRFFVFAALIQKPDMFSLSVRSRVSFFSLHSILKCTPNELL